VKIISTRALHPENMKTLTNYEPRTSNTPRNPQRETEAFIQYNRLLASTSRARYMWWIIYPAIW
jgi:hypothetical protein